MNDCKFTLIWKNKVIRNIILQYLKQFNIFYYQRYFPSLKLYQQFPNKQYLQGVDFDFVKEIDLDTLPTNIESLNFSYSRKELNSSGKGGIPKWIKSIKVPLNYDFSLFKDIENLSRLVLFKVRVPLYKQIELPASLLKTVTDLEIIDYQFPITKDLLAPSVYLKKFTINICGNNKDICSYIEEGALPNTIQDLTIHGRNDEFKTISNDILPNSLVKLKILNQYLELSSDFKLPKSITQLHFKVRELLFKLPENLKVLHLTTNNFNKSHSALLPSKLEHLNLSLDSIRDYEEQELTRDMLPDRLLTLELGKYTNFIDSNGLSILPDGLEKLYFQNIYGKNKRLGNQRLLPNVLPMKSLKRLIFGGYGGGSFNNAGYPLLEENLFSNKLEYIDFGDLFNQEIGVNVFPRSGNLKKIIFGLKFNQKIHPDSIPNSVNYIEIKHLDYQHIIQLNDANQDLIIETASIFSFVESYRDRPDELKSIILPSLFEESIDDLSLQQFTNLEKVFLNFEYNQSLNKNQFSQDNKIKVLSLGCLFRGYLNLSDFKFLEYLIIDYSNPKIIFDSNKSSNDNISKFNNLKTIEVPTKNVEFLDSIDKSFYPLIKLKR